MNLDLTADLIAVDANKGKISIAIQGADVNEILKQIPLEQVISYYDKREMLDAIGKDTAAEYFDLEGTK